MAKVTLKSLKLVNFKGVQSFEADFNHTTSIYGENAAGKTTVFDAFLWLFFGKNSEDASQFEVKRLDKNNQFIKDLEAEVCATILVDGVEIVIRKVLKQKWVRRRGEQAANYNGDENVYFWNDVPFKESDFKVKVAGIVDEKLFRLITNPFYFNSLKWQDRRSMLVDLAGTITNEQVLTSLGVNPMKPAQYADLITALNQNKSLDEFKRELAAKKKRIKDEAESLPARIDEVQRSLPKETDYHSIRNLLQAYTVELETIQKILNDEVAKQADENSRRSSLLKEYHLQVQQRQNDIFGIQTKMRNIEFEIKQQAGQATGQLNAELNSITKMLADKRVQIDTYSRTLATLSEKVDAATLHLETLREDYLQMDIESLPAFDDKDFCCPACKQALPDSDIEAKKEELLSNFNKNKLQNMESLRSQGEQVKKDIEALGERISNGKTGLAELEKEADLLMEKQNILFAESSQPRKSLEEATASLLSTHIDYQQLKAELANKEATVLNEPVFEPQKANEQLMAQRSEINAKIVDLNKELATEEALKKAHARIAELKDRETALAQELVDLEGSEFAILQFTKAKIETIEKRINSKFNYVAFKMFTTQVNGGEAECCETLVNTNGAFVPFGDANNAGKINAGIDIINAFTAHYGIYAPIFVDNRESVTNLIDSDSQIVNLIVSPGDTQLRVA